jgi:hypothetical protein
MRVNTVELTGQEASEVCQDPQRRCGNVPYMAECDANFGWRHGKHKPASACEGFNA